MNQLTNDQLDEIAKKHWPKTQPTVGMRNMMHDAIDAAQALPLSINTNSQVEVVLTKLGADVHTAYYWQFPADLRPPVLNAGDKLSDTLWHLMVIFGQHIHYGGELPFENNTVTLTELR